MKSVDQAFLYNQAALRASREVTHTYSTSFGWAVRLLPGAQRQAIYALYGFVRVADEIVDSELAADPRTALDKFQLDFTTALASGYSENIIIHAFVGVVKKYHIEVSHVTAFFESMEMDVGKRRYSKAAYRRYIFGSAEVIGLMCLRIFCEHDEQKFNRLRPSAAALGAGFQKVNFLRDFASDYHERGRVYFPGVNYDRFDDANKREIEAEIYDDFGVAISGINNLPTRVRLAVTAAYCYYNALTQKLQRVSASDLRQRRVRVSNMQKAALLAKTCFYHGLLRQPVKQYAAQGLSKAV